MRIGFLLTILLFCHGASAAVIVGFTETHSGALAYRDGQFVGQLAPLYSCVFGKIDAPLEVRVAPQARVLADLKIGSIDIGLPFAQSSERDEYAVFADPLLSVEFIAYSQNVIKNPMLLAGERFALPLGTRTIELVEERGGEAVEVLGYVEAFRMLQAGRVTATLLPSVAVEPYLALTDGWIRTKFGSIPAGFYVNREAISLLVDVNQAIAECRRTF